MSLESLPLLIKFKIASYSGECWYNLVNIDKKFGNYSITPDGLKSCKKLFGKDDNFCKSDDVLSFSQLKENTTYYAQYQSFYESKSFQLWCSDSFNKNRSKGGMVWDHTVPVIKKNEQLYLDLDNIHFSCSKLRVINNEKYNHYFLKIFHSSYNIVLPEFLFKTDCLISIDFIRYLMHL